MKADEQCAIDHTVMDPSDVQHSIYGKQIIVANKANSKKQKQSF